MRILAFGLLIFYHLGMLYVSWGFSWGFEIARRIAWLRPTVWTVDGASFRWRNCAAQAAWCAVAGDWREGKRC